MKKEITAVICVILSVWFFFMGFELGSYREKKKINTTQTQVFQPMSQSNYNSQSVSASSEQPQQSQPSQSTQPFEPTSVYPKSTSGQATPTTKPAAKDPASM